MRKPRARSRILKKLPRAPGGNCAQEGACPRHDRNLVRRRGPHRPEEQDHPPLGQARHPSKRTAGPTDRFHLHLRCSLPEGGQGCSPDHAGLQHRGDELAPRRDRRNRRARCPRHPPGRSSRLAFVHAPPRAGQYHHHSAAAEVPRAQPGRERLAVHARQLALQPHLQILRRSRRPLLCGMEQARRSALAHHVHRTAPMGPRVLINGIWYYSVIVEAGHHLSCQGAQNGRMSSQDLLVNASRGRRTMTMSLEAAAQAMREAMRQSVKRHSLWYLVQGGLMILAGILALVYPVVSSFAAVFLLGCVLIVSGVVQGISLIDARNVPHFWLQLVSVVLSVIVGVLLIRHRGAGLLVLTLLLLVYFMVEGISKVIFSLTIRPFPNWGWLLASGIVTILIAFYLWASLPVTAIWLLGVLLGIQLICEGAALGYLAWQVRTS